ncbi:MAG: hypothetical protein Q8Q73_10855 [Stagnimonas sp.]|nr:hypothetical protein [Stagnimonas sp.]
MRWNRRLLFTKFKALGTHLGISGLLVAVALWLMLVRWLPTPLFHTDGGGIGLKLIVLVDLVLGPLLTFVVFDPAKSRRALGLDFTVIALVQLGAYGYGLHNVHAVRVQALAYYEGAFHTVTPAVLAEQVIEPGGWQPLGARAPYLVDTREPANDDEAGGVGSYALVSGLEPYQLHFLYRPYAEAARQHWSRGWSLAALERQQPEVAAKARAWLQDRDLAAESVRFYRVEGYFENAALVIDAQGRWLGGFAAELPVLPPP